VLPPNALVKHDQAAGQAGETVVGDGDRQEEDDARRGKIEENENEEELPELDEVGHEADEAVDDATEDDRRHQSERDYVEKDLGEEVGDRRVVAVGTGMGSRAIIGAGGRQPSSGLAKALIWSRRTARA
jgi:hypothetical protein